MTPIRRLAIIASAAALLLVSGCSAASAPSNDAPVSPNPAVETPPAADELSGDLTIFAAASLTASFTQLADEFMAQHPGVTIPPITFDGSSTLVTQLTEGAPADVFAAADQANMTKADEAGVLAGPATDFASNTMAIAVQPGNPKNITSLADLVAPGLQVVLCAPEVPCGAVANTLLADDGVNLTPVSEEQNVKAVVTKVQLGEADAGLVYTTDVRAADGAIDGVPIASAEKAANSYPIAVLAHAPNPIVANAFVQFVLSDEAQQILAGYGFGKP